MVNSCWSSRARGGWRGRREPDSQVFCHPNSVHQRRETLDGHGATFNRLDHHHHHNPPLPSPSSLPPPHTPHTAPPPSTLLLLLTFPRPLHTPPPPPGSLLHADPCTSLATVLHAPDRHQGEDAISAWWLLMRLCPSGVPVIAMIDANAEVGSEVTPFIGNKDAAQDHRAASVDVALQLPCTGQRLNRNFASRRALRLPDVAQRSEALWRSVPSWPQHWHIDRMEASFTKLARIIFATVAPPEKRCPKADWITSDTWAAVELHRDYRHHFFARIRQRKSLLLRLVFWAWSRFTFDQARKARADLADNRVGSALQALSAVCRKAGSQSGSSRPSFLVASSSHQHSIGSRQCDLCVSQWFLNCRVHVFSSVRPVFLPGVLVSCSRSPLSSQCSIYACALVRTVPYFLVGSLFGCLAPCFLMGSLSGWCFVLLDLLASPAADGFSCAFWVSLDIACTKIPLCFLVSLSMLLPERGLVSKATASMSSMKEPILKLSGVLYQSDRGLPDGPRHLGQLLWVMGMYFVCVGTCRRASRRQFQLPDAGILSCAFL